MIRKICEKIKDKIEINRCKFFFTIFIILQTFFVPIVSKGERFAILADTHLKPHTASDTALRRIVDEINLSKLDFVVLNGDLSNEGSNAELDYVKSIVDKIHHPLYVIPGNHENNWSQSASRHFVELWGADRFAADHENFFIVGLNCGPYMKMGDGHVKREDLLWLKGKLESAKKSGKKVISFNHYPLNNEIDNIFEYLSVLEPYNVIVHFNGHHHKYMQYGAGVENSDSTLSCFGVRALNSGDNYGYTIVEIDDKWIRLYDKQIEKEPVEICKSQIKLKHCSASRPTPLILSAPKRFKVELVASDSASIFTRLGFDKKGFYFGNSLGIVRGIDKGSLQELWAFETGAPLFGRPQVLQSGKVAVPAYNGIHFLNAKSGRRLGFYESREGPYVADGLVADGKYFQGGYGRMECHDIKDGKLVWSYDSIGNYCQASPTIYDKDLLFGAWDTNLRSVDTESGRLNWIWNNGRQSNMHGPGNVVPVVTDSKVIIVAPDRYMTALDRATGKLLWRDNSHRYRESLGMSEDGKRAYAKTMDGELVAIDLESDNFRELWKTDLTIGYDHAPCVIVEKDGFVFAGSRRGLLSVVNANGGELVSLLPLGSSEINGLDIDPFSGAIYLSLIEGLIYRITILKP